jgi:formate hydrogenlyase subunit 3/multisubunit Na+/H+ antiporter MnhD subunit
VLLFFLITIAGEGSPPAAGKTFVMIGAADCAMLLGIVLIWKEMGTLDISALREVPMQTGMTHWMYALLLAGVITKAGAMPGHSWIPKAAETAPTSVMAFLPAALDKLLGIYLLARMSLYMFAPSDAMKLTLLIIGAVTIILAVMAALVQHELKKLLACHAVSQVGYMLMGIGTGVTLGIIGGLFHMLNNAIYKGCLFLGAGAIERKAGTTELEKLGGLASAMPVTFGACLISALAISGVPPLNGFASKWFVYQGVLQVGRPVFVVAAMFGSALTLASFIKVIYSVFLGKRPESLRSIKPAGFSMTFPMIFLALLCIVFGVFYELPLGQFIGPAVGGKAVVVPNLGLWKSTLATGLIVIGLVIGVVIYLFGTAMKVRTTSVFVGGEVVDAEESRVPGTGFYKTVTDMPGLGTIYRDAEQGTYDLYVLGGRYGKKIVDVLRGMHTGIVSTYVALSVAGLGIILFLLLR